MSSTCSHLVRSTEPGENWSWCYLDNVAFVLADP